MIVKRIGVWSLAKMYGALSAGMGLIFGAIFALFSLVGSGLAAVAAEEGEAMGAFFGMLFGAGAVIFMPLFYGLMGVVMGAISAIIYNLAARFVGGLRLEVEPEASMSPPAAPVSL